MVNAYTVHNTRMPSGKVLPVILSKLIEYFDEFVSSKITSSFISVIDIEVEKFPQTVNNRVCNSSSRNPVVLGEPSTISGIKYLR